MIYITFTSLYMPYYRRRTGRKFKVYRRRTLVRSNRSRSYRRSSYKSYYKGADVTHFTQRLHF